MLTILAIASAVISCTQSNFTSEGGQTPFSNNETSSNGTDDGSGTNDEFDGGNGPNNGENGGYGPLTDPINGSIHLFAPPGTPTSQSYVVPPPGNRKVDILFVVDPSGSMQDEQQTIGERFTNLTDTIADLDWRIAITSSDMSVGGNAAGHDGRLIEMAGLPGVYYLDKNTANAQLVFQNTIQLPSSPTDGDDDERGIFNAIRVIEKSATHNFFRPGAFIHTVMISDEDERSSGENLELRDLPFSLINTAGAFFPAGGLTSHSIITRPGDTQCKASSGKTYGEVYAELTNLTGGYLGDICADDYAVVLSGIGQTIQYVGVRSLTLPCVPKTGSVSFVGGAPATFQGVDGNKLQFSQDLTPGTLLVVNFVCAL